MELKTKKENEKTIKAEPSKEQKTQAPLLFLPEEEIKLQIAKQISNLCKKIEPTRRAKMKKINWNIEQGVLRIGNLCFVGNAGLTKDVAIMAIKRKYQKKEANRYINIINRLYKESKPAKEFNWRRLGRYVAQYYPEYLDKEKFNWEIDSWAVAKFCPEKIEPEKFNWEEESWAVAKYCPEYLDPNKYNWEDFSHSVAEYCPHKIDKNKFNWEENKEEILIKI